MSDVAFPATSRDQFPSALHCWLDRADQYLFDFPSPEEMVAPEMREFRPRQERAIKFAYFNYWLATLRVYYINKAWEEAHEYIEDGRCGELYSAAIGEIDTKHYYAVMELHTHYGYDYEGPLAG